MDCPDLADGVRLIITYFRHLRARAWWRNHVQGGVYVIEATAQPEGWHVHIHAIIQGDYLPQKHLSKLWLQISGACITYIQFVKKDDAPVSYLMKYLSKSSVPDDRRPQVTSALRSVRLFSRFGTFHHIDVKIARRVCMCPQCHTNDWVHDRTFDRAERWESTA